MYEESSVGTTFSVLIDVSRVMLSDVVIVQRNAEPLNILFTFLFLVSTSVTARRNSTTVEASAHSCQSKYHSFECEINHRRRKNVNALKGFVCIHVDFINKQTKPQFK